MPTRQWSPGIASLLVLIGIVLTTSGCGGAQARKARHLAKGNTYLVAGNYEKARVEFLNALQIAPLDPEARFDNGVVNEKLGKVREAAQFYQGTIDVSPDHLGARTHFARLLVFSGAPDRALELIMPALDKHPDDSELLALRAAVRVQQKDLSGGEVDAERAVQADPNNPDAVATLAGIYTSTRHPEKAAGLLEESIKRMPAEVDLRLALAQVYAGESRDSDTERVLLDLVRLRPADAAFRIRLAQFYARKSQLDASEHVIREGIAAMPRDRQLKAALIDFLISRRSAAIAEQELKAMLAADPKDFDLMFALATFYESSGKPAAAEKMYREVISREGLDSAGLTARDHLAALLAQREDVPGAEKLIAEVLSKSPRDNDALSLRGDLELLQKNPKAAIADLRAVLRDQPNAVPVLRALARAHLANGEPAIAEETMRRAVEANPKNQGLRLDLAQLLVQLGKPEQAKPIAADVVKGQPDNMPALDTLFQIGAATKDYTTAKTAADAMVAAQPNAALGFLYQGMIAEQEKHLDEALRLYAHATDLQPDALEPLRAEIRLLVAEKRMPEAMKRLDVVAAAAPNAALASDIKGDLLLSQGRISEAQEAYQLSIKRGSKWWLPYQGLANAQFAAKESDAALATLRNAQAVVDRPEQLGIRIGQYYERSNNPDAAIAQYQEVIDHHPEAELAANNLAMLLVTYRSDVASLDRARALSARFAESSNPSFLDTYGWVLYKHGEATASVPVLERVVAKAPDAPVALYHLGMAQSLAGSNVQARQNLERAINSGERFHGLDEARATLDKLAKLVSKDNPTS